MGYQQFASVADDYWRSFGPEFSELIRPRLERTLRQFRIHPGTLLDLGCGTGSFAVAMARRGWKVAGLDASRAVLRIARRKSRENKVSVRFVQGDMRGPITCFRDTRFELVTSIFNSVNHLLSKRDLGRMFESVAENLQTGGYFFFDVNNRNCFEEVWGGTSLVRDEKFILVRQDHLDIRRSKATAHLLIFFPKASRFVVEEDSIEERWYSDEEIEEAARRASLTVVKKEDFNPFPRALGFSSNIKSAWLLRRIG
jgi:SAM-dependent methyltransferase